MHAQEQPCNTVFIRKKYLRAAGNFLIVERLSARGGRNIGLGRGARNSGSK